MSTPTVRGAGVVLLAIVAVACADPAAPPTDPPGSETTNPALVLAVSGARARHERLARRLALALADADLRANLAGQFLASPYPEGKIHLQAMLSADRGAIRAALARATHEQETAVARDAEESGPLEVYLPVPAHRAAWNGSDQYLVATAIADGERPVAFDAHGRRSVLSADQPPAAPVLVIGPSEQSFTRPGRSAEELVCNDCGSSGPVTTTPGLYMTSAGFTGTFESWFKGKPEFETHVIGQDGQTTGLTSYQCAGEHAGGPYTYDQNDKTWSGSVLLFSQAQLDAFRIQHPGQALRFLVIEDDETACVIKTDNDRVTSLFTALDDAYRYWTGGRDEGSLPNRVFKAAQVFQRFFAAVASFVNTNDDIVGTAIEDAVAGRSWPGANWIVKDDRNVTRGGIRLEMR